MTKISNVPYRGIFEVRKIFFLFIKVDSISTIELEQKLKQNIQLIGVRTPGEFRRDHIKNAKNIPLNKIGSYTPVADKKTYVICHSGARSKLAAKKLKKRDFDVVNIQGGMHALRSKIV